jgi:hypothetical protein
MFANRILIELILGLVSLAVVAPRIPTATDWMAGYDPAQEAREQKNYSIYVHELPRLRQCLRYVEVYGNPNSAAWGTANSANSDQRHAIR